MGTDGKYLILGLKDAGKRTLLKHLAIGDLETSEDGKVTSLQYKGIQLHVSSCCCTDAATAVEPCSSCCVWCNSIRALELLFEELLPPPFCCHRRPGTWAGRITAGILDTKRKQKV